MLCPKNKNLVQNQFKWVYYVKTVITNLSSTHVSLVVEAELSQGVVSWKCLNQSHYSLPRHVVGLNVQAGDGRVLPQHLSDGQRHGVIGSGVCQAEDPHVCVGPQRFGKSDQGFLGGESCLHLYLIKYF